jgi:hypothetical protein
MFASVRTTMEQSHTSTQTQEIIIRGLTDAICTGKNEVDLSTLSFTPHGILYNALKEQNAIGWTNFYKGRLSKKWQQIQHAQFHGKKGENADPQRWATSLISAMWQGFLQMWEDQNNDQHGRDSNEATAKEREKLLQKTKQLYELKDKIDPEDRRLYHKPVAQWENETNRQIREWINLAEPLTKNHKKTTRNRKVDPRQPLIMSFFTSMRNEAVPRNTRTYTRRPPRQNQDEE